MAAVNLEKLWKRYGKNAAVQDINLAIRDGEFVSLLGPSGCGKTSTMRMVAGLEQISEGHIYFDGDPVDALPPSQRKVAMAFENYALYPTLDVFENLAFPMRAQGWKQADIERRVREVAGIMRLTEILGQKVTNLSNGQQQAVGLARALTRHPNVLLLDEPISHLDTGHRTNMRAYLKRLHVDLGYTMIYVTHDQEEAMAMSDRIAVMNGGRINQVGTAAEIYDHPADTFVAGFIGEPAMNLLDCDREGDLLRLNARRHADSRALSAGGRGLPARAGARYPAVLHRRGRRGGREAQRAGHRVRVRGAGRHDPDHRQARRQRRAGREAAGVPSQARRSAMARLRAKPHPVVRQEYREGHCDVSANFCVGESGQADWGRGRPPLRGRARLRNFLRV